MNVVFSCQGHNKGDQKYNHKKNNMVGMYRASHHVESEE